MPFLHTFGHFLPHRIVTNDELAHILLGNGAGAALIHPTQGFARIADVTLHTDGGTSEILFIAEHRLHMDGPAVLLHASRKVPRAITALLARNHLDPAAIGHVLMH